MRGSDAADRDAANSRIGTMQPPDYQCAPVEDWGGDVAQGSVSEAEIRAALDQDGSITAAYVLVASDPELGMGYVPKLAVSWMPGQFVTVAAYRGRRPRNWKDFTTLLQQLATWGYRGKVIVLRRDDPEARDLGLVGTDPAE